MPAKTRRYTFLFYYLVSSAAIIMLFGDGNWITDFRLARSGVPVRAELTAASCGSELPLAYRFSAGGASYQGRGKDGFGNPPCARLKPGDSLLVYHVAAEPSISLPGNPWDRLVTESAGILMAALLAPVILLFLLFAALRIFGSSTRRR